MNLIWLLLRASRIQVAIAILTGLISGGTSARLIALINSAISGNYTQDLATQFPILALVVLVSSIVSQVLLIKLSQNAVYKLRLGLSDGILYSPLRHLEELGASKLLATLTEDVSTLSSTVYAIPFICVDIAVIVGCLGYMLWLSGTVFAFTIGFLMMGVGSVQILIGRADYFLKLARGEQDNLFQHFRAITDGVKELKLNATRRQDFFTEDLQVSAAKSRNQNSAALFTYSVSTGWGNLLFFILIGLLLFTVPQFISIAPSVLSAYVLTLTYMMLPMQSILDKLQQLARASVALEKIHTMGLSLAAQTENNQFILHPITHNWNKLELEEVTHTYRSEKEDSKFTLGPINLTFNQGEVVFIVGGNGSGKSSLAKLITGLYTPESGKIRLNNKLITDDNREWYRQHFSVVFSDYYLFERITGLDSKLAKTQASEYLRELQLDSKVEIKDNKLSTTSLSQGQRKRLALLAAYLENRPIYLFDEWASDQDPIFREIFYKQIIMNLKQRGKTVIVISHDDHFFAVADRIIKLDYGKIEYDKSNRVYG
ncbi:ABC transporter ATP-binding protein [Dulcicalothrix desertica PCC 7102]|uniref:ABC transporter ATP-binding protein n=1 Tax=Dulcicalothrix desertica PCC 7102 TaxID=232991 RepID=A0A3S1CK37_9CYAN|nr:cyclic peptide export ABC transporter [Dulcicalothrix desertica]RUT05156.1 ABC transporter ATP-binding protein [Dulcicalothrix desertica PCC 7102]TWH43337.1 putative ATP-binding cassette transporter [Dulcicalothrix desertica PCC 7102]